MAEANFYLRSTLPGKSTAVMLFFSYNNKRLKICTIEHIDPVFWDKDNQRASRSKEFPTHPEFNQRLKDVRNICLNVYRKYLNDHSQQQPEATEIKTLIHDEILHKDHGQPIVNFNLISFTEHYVNQIKTGKRLAKTGKPLSNSVLKIHKTFLEVLKGYQQSLRKTLTFDDITLDFYFDFKEYLNTTKKYSINTVGKHIRTLKSVLIEATEAGVNSRMDFRSKRFIAPTENVDNIYLSPLELEVLFNLDLSKNTRLERVRDLFLVGAWTGLRFSDFSDITPKNIKDDYIQIKTKKTGKEVVIPIHATIRIIMERYTGLTENNLPPALSNQKMNNYLKELGKVAGLDEIIQKTRTTGGTKVVINHSKFELITTHTARRSFATNMYNMNVPALTIMKITGHTTDTSFMKYIKVTPMEHAVQLREIWQRQILRKVD